MSLRIFLNDNLPEHRAQRGIARYFDAIIDAAVASFGAEAVVFSPNVRDHGNATCIQAPRFPGSNFLRFHDRLASFRASRQNINVIHSAYYGRFRSVKPTIITVYDMILELLPQYFQKFDISNPWFLAEKRRCMEQADVLIAISESTAHDIITCYPHISPAKIITIHLGVNEAFLTRTNRPVSTEKPFFLYVGNRFLPYKNFTRLLIAFGRSGLAQEFNLRIISPKGNSLSADERQQIDQYHVQESLHIVEDASEELLRTCYATTYALIYPSEYEGFGLPILEAMASGTLVATSNVSSMPEVGGDVAYYFDPYSIESMVDTLLRITSLPTDERAERVAKGVARARAFTWNLCQQKTIEIYRRMEQA